MIHRAMALEDLETNRVLQLLQSKQYETIYTWVQQYGGLICVPHSRKIRNIKIDKDFLELHTFRPSLLLKDNFVSSCKRRSYSVLIEGTKILTVEGYPQGRTVNIVGEEDGYGKTGKIFKILLIDGPLVGQGASIEENSEELFFNTDKKWTSDECVNFLSSFVECQNVISSLDGELLKFSKNYMVVRGYLDDAVDRLHGMWQEAANNFLLSVTRPYAGDKRFQAIVCRAIDSYIMKKVHQKVFPVVCSECETEDSELNKQCRILSNPQSLKDLTNHRTTSIDYQKLMRHLVELDESSCPHDKLLCLKALLDEIIQEVGTCRSSTSPTEGTSEYLTSDDFIPILARIVVLHEGHSVVSNMYYMEHFRLYQKAADSLSFSLVTLKAASSFVLNFLRKEPEVESKPLKEQDAVVENLSSSNGNPKKNMSNISAAKLIWGKDLCRELDSISRQSSVSARSVSAVGASHSANGKSGGNYLRENTSSSASKDGNSGLGEFLSALRADSRSVAYGKQN